MVVAVDITIFVCLLKMSWAIDHSTRNKLKGHFFTTWIAYQNELFLNKACFQDRPVVATLIFEVVHHTCLQSLAIF